MNADIDKHYLNIKEIENRNNTNKNNLNNDTMKHEDEKDKNDA